MANNFILRLDTLGPSGLSFTISGGSAFTPTPIVDLDITHTDSDVLQMKVWGDVDLAYNVDIQDTEEHSAWITYTQAKQIKLADGDSSKAIYVRLRDDVYNESNFVSQLITLDTTIPLVTVVSGPTPNKISKQLTKNVAQFTFQASEIFTEYKVTVVGSVGDSQSAGITIPVAAGSLNMAGSGNFPADVIITCDINGADLEAASAGDSDKIVKVFVKDRAGNWSA